MNQAQICPLRLFLGSGATRYQNIFIANLGSIRAMTKAQDKNKVASHRVRSKTSVTMETVLKLERIFFYILNAIRYRIKVRRSQDHLAYTEQDVAKNTIGGGIQPPPGEIGLITAFPLSRAIALLNRMEIFIAQCKFTKLCKISIAALHTAINALIQLILPLARANLSIWKYPDQTIRPCYIMQLSFLSRWKVNIWCPYIVEKLSVERKLLGFVEWQCETVIIPEFT